MVAAMQRASRIVRFFLCESSSTPEMRLILSDSSAASQREKSTGFGTSAYLLQQLDQPVLRGFASVGLSTRPEKALPHPRVTSKLLIGSRCEETVLRSGQFQVLGLREFGRYLTS